MINLKFEKPKEIFFKLNSKCFLKKQNFKNKKMILSCITKTSIHLISSNGSHKNLYKSLLIKIQEQLLLKYH